MEIACQGLSAKSFNFYVFHKFPDNPRFHGLRLLSDLLVHTLVFVVKTVVGTRACVSAEELHHFVLVQIHLTAVAVIFLVVIIEDAGLTIDGTAFLRCGFQARLPPVVGDL